MTSHDPFVRAIKANFEKWFPNSKLIVSETNALGRHICFKEPSKQRPIVADTPLKGRNLTGDEQCYCTAFEDGWNAAKEDK